jgi:hypothetical protein
VVAAQEWIDGDGEEYYEEDDEEVRIVSPRYVCPACGGDGGILGQLGQLTHCRCRQCGIDFSERSGT